MSDEDRVFMVPRPRARPRLENSKSGLNCKSLSDPTQLNQF